MFENKRNIKLIQPLSIALAICFCWALPVAAQKNIKPLQPGLARRVQGAQQSAALSRPLAVKTLKIINLPARPSVRILLPTAPHVKNSVRLLPPRQVYPTLHKLGKRKMFVPRDFVNQTEALYRGMAIASIDELKNILTNGLELKKSNYPKQIFTAYNPLTAVLYSQPTHRFNAEADLPVLVKIPRTPALAKYAPEEFATALAFRKSVPAEAISDVWVLLEVNKQADWYKAFLEEGEVVLLPADGQLQDAP